MLAIVNMKTSARVFALGIGSPIARDLETTYDMLDQLIGGQGPDPDVVKTMTPYFKTIAQKMADFYSLPIVDSDGRPDAEGRLMYGGEAVHNLFSRVGTRMSNGDLGKATLQMMRPLKTYHWLLTDGQRAELKSWYQDNCSAIAKNASNAIEDATSTAIVLHVEGGSSSSSSGMVVPPQATGPQTKKAKNQFTKEQANKTHVMKFFKSTTMQ